MLKWKMAKVFYIIFRILQFSLGEYSFIVVFPIKTEFIKYNMIFVLLLLLSTSFPFAHQWRS